MTGLRLMLFDRTSRGHAMCHLWRMGGALYRQLDRLDGYFGASSWSEGLDWLARFQPDRPICQIQFWGHGRWGRALVDQEALDQRCLEESHPLHPTLVAVQRRLVPQGLWWFRTCETLGATAGQHLACALSDFLGCRVAGHTHIIGFYQSGLHSLAPGEQPGWDAREGLLRGTPDAPEQAHTSRPWAPNTITCLHGRVPRGF